MHKLGFTKFSLTYAMNITRGACMSIVMFAVTFKYK